MSEQFFEEALWDEVMFDWFPNHSPEEIEEILMDLIPD